MYLLEQKVDSLPDTDLPNWLART